MDNVKVIYACLLVGLATIPKPAAAQDGIVHARAGPDPEGRHPSGWRRARQSARRSFHPGQPDTGGSQPTSQVDQASIDAVVNFGNSLRSQFANFPLGSSSGGFTYSFDSATGTYSRSSTSFGPAFMSNAMTMVVARRAWDSITSTRASTPFLAELNMRGGAIDFTSVTRIVAAERHPLHRARTIRGSKATSCRRRWTCMRRPTPSRCSPTSASPTTSTSVSPSRFSPGRP